MAVNLVKGQNTVLNMNVFHVGLGWVLMKILPSTNSIWMLQLS